MVFKAYKQIKEEGITEMSFKEFCGHLIAMFIVGIAIGQFLDDVFPIDWYFKQTIKEDITWTMFTGWIALVETFIILMSIPYKRHVEMDPILKDIALGLERFKKV
jgi:hypothetical protein